MRKIMLVLVLCHACLNQSTGSSPTPSDPTAYDDVNRQPTGIFAEVEVLSVMPWRYDDPRGFNTTSGSKYRLRMRRAQPPNPSIGDEELRTSFGEERDFLLISHLRDVPVSASAGTFDDRPGRAQLAVGRRVIIFAEMNSIPSRALFWIKRAWHIDTATDTVAEPCAGFPAGTPIAQVLAPRVYAPADAGTPDAPAASDASGD